MSLTFMQAAYYLAVRCHNMAIVRPVKGYWGNLALESEWLYTDLLVERKRLLQLALGPKTR